MLFLFLIVEGVKLAVPNRLKTIELKKSTSITFYWVKEHAGLKGNERADYLAKIAAS